MSNPMAGQINIGTLTEGVDLLRVYSLLSLIMIEAKKKGGQEYSDEVRDYFHERCDEHEGDKREALRDVFKMYSHCLPSEIPR